MNYYDIKIANNNDLVIGQFKNELKLNTYVIVEDEVAQNYGKIISKKQFKKKTDALKILREATPADEKIYYENLKIAKEALILAKKEASKLALEMRFIDSNLTFDKNQLLITYYSENRIDFRQLAKKLASVYKTRIELHQIGTRDKAKKIGGCGLCGEKLCCSRFLTHLNSVSMNMAKNQNLALNPTKINGVCGRLLCCLAYEDNTYTNYKKNLPKLNEKIETEYGVGKVINIDVLAQKYTVDIDGKTFEVLLNDESNK